MFYKKVESEYGPYRDNNDGSLYDIFEATKVMTPQGINHGWDAFDNIDDASLAYGLTYIGEQDSESIEVVLKRILDEEVNR